MYSCLIEVSLDKLALLLVSGISAFLFFYFENYELCLQTGPADQRRDEEELDDDSNNLLLDRRLLDCTFLDTQKRQV